MTREEREQRNFTIKRAIEATAKNGIVTPDAVVEAARRPSHPLHSEFDWDDASAAHQHRLERARELIRAVRYVVVDDGEKIIQAVHYVHDPRQNNRDQGYIPLTSAARDRDLARKIITDELRRCASAISRACSVSEILGLTTDFRDLMAEVNRLMAEANKPEKKRGRRRRGDDDQPSPVPA